MAAVRARHHGNAPEFQPGEVDPYVTYAGFQLSENFNVSELTVSAARPDLVEPVPGAYQPAVTRIVVTVLQPLRDWLSDPVKVLSGYRSRSLNAAIGGSDTSQHLRAEAADITLPGLAATFENIMSGGLPLPVGQVIIYPPQNFIHIALPSARYPRPAFFLHDPGRALHYHPLGDRNELARLLDMRVA